MLSLPSDGNRLVLAYRSVTLIDQSLLDPQATNIGILAWHLIEITKPKVGFELIYFRGPGGSCVYNRVGSPSLSGDGTFQLCLLIFRGLTWVNFLTEVCIELHIHLLGLWNVRNSLMIP